MSKNNRQYAPLRHQHGGLSKTILATIGLLTIVLVIVAVVAFKFQGTDEFNYANEKAPQLVDNRDQWSSIEWLDPISVHVDQAQAVFYWQTENEFSWKCKSKDGIDQGPSGEIIIRHNSCLFYLPLQQSTIKLNQSSVVLVRPQTSTQVDVTQSELRIAENGQAYRFDLASKHSDIDSFKSHDNAEIQISIAATESVVSAY
jgi:hypothetical protein